MKKLGLALAILSIIGMVGCQTTTVRSIPEEGEANVFAASATVAVDFLVVISKTYRAADTGRKG